MFTAAYNVILWFNALIYVPPEKALTDVHRSTWLLNSQKGFSIRYLAAFQYFDVSF